MAINVDVIVPVYNRRKYIAAALRSVDAQTLKPRSIIVVDDGSTDDTPLVLRDYLRKRAAALPAIVLIDKPNGGASSARNAGIGASSADYLAFLDSDDLWHPSKLERQIETFHSSDVKNLGVVYCDYEVIDSDGKQLVNSPGFRFDPSVRGEVFSRLLTGNLVASSGSGVLARKTCFDQCGLFDENLSAAEDWDMWLRISRRFGFDYVREPLVQIRRHETNLSSDTLQVFFSDFKVLSKYVENSEVRKQVKTVVIRTLLFKPPSRKAFVDMLTGRRGNLKSLGFSVLDRLWLLGCFVLKRLWWRAKRLFATGFERKIRSVELQ